jgi:hypothetical protein
MAPASARWWTLSRRSSRTGDAAGNLYATWDTQGPGGDIGWLSFGHGWLCGPAQVSTGFGASAVWPGDTIGISALPQNQSGKTPVMLSWGSAVDGTTSQIWATSVPAC